MTIRPQEIIERALAASTSHGCVVVVEVADSANLRWANNTVTTSGTGSELSWFVVAFVATGGGIAAGAVSSTTTDPVEIESVVRAAEAAARDAGPASDAAELIAGPAEARFQDEPASSDFGVFDALVHTLGVAFDEAGSADRILYGFARHRLATTYLGSSTGLRRRWVQPTGTVELNAKSTDLARSAWAGVSTDDFAEVDVATLARSLGERLAWASRTVSLPPGRYDTVLPPTAVADLMLDLAWTASARAAHEGRSAFSAAGGSGTRIGERLTELPLSLFGDPRAAGVESVPFVVTASSGDEVSVFDNGADIGRTTLVDHGVISGLATTRAVASDYREPFTPLSETLVLSGGDQQRSVLDLVADVDRGLLLTSLWYVRTVDPMAQLLTGLTRDGVYLVERGEIVGAVNNFRFNMSTLDVFRRCVAASRTERTLSREWGDWFTRTLMPALRVDGFHLSSVSAAQ